MFGSGLETLPDVRKPLRMTDSDRIALLDVRALSGDPPGWPGVVGGPYKYPGVVGRPTRMSGSGWETLPDVREPLPNGR